MPGSEIVKEFGVSRKGKRCGVSSLDFFFPGICHFSLQSQKSGEKAMGPHSSTPAWKIPGMDEPGRLQFMGSRRVGHD